MEIFDRLHVALTISLLGSWAFSESLAEWFMRFIWVYLFTWAISSAWFKWRRHVARKRDSELLRRSLQP